QLPDEEEVKAKKAQETNSWSLGELGLTTNDSLPWWRRNKTQREVDPAFDSALVGDKATELIDRTPNEEFGVELIEDLLKAEDAVKKFTGEVTPQPGATGIRDDDGGAGALLPGFNQGAAARGAAGEFEGTRNDGAAE